MPLTVKVAAVQSQPAFKDTEQNRSKVIDAVRIASANHAQLIVFPECALSGYHFSSRDEALPCAEAVPGTTTEELVQVCQELNSYVVLGLLEREGDTLFNTGILVGPDGLIGRYRKSHLPHLGVDRFTTAGNEAFRVFRMPVGNIGIHICYDILFPETARVMALMGADILALPTNFPSGRGEKALEHIVTTRALENRVHFIAANRVGTEGNITFAGMSKITDATGETLSLASQNREEIIYGTLDLALARQKRLVITPGQYEVDYVKDRRPELYGIITIPENDNGPQS